MKRALCVLAIGSPYQKLFAYKRQELERYARVCRAELVVIDQPLDPMGRRSILSQKMLIPFHFHHFEAVVSLDLDIHISAQAPDLFEIPGPEAGFAAVCDPRNSEMFRRTWSAFPEVLNETTESYFRQRGFSDAQGLLGSINGGVMFFQPHLVAELFKNYYDSNHEQNGVGDGNEEAPLAFLSQSRGLFVPLNPKFNCQLLYHLKGTDQGLRLTQQLERTKRRWHFGSLRKWLGLKLEPWY